MRMHLVRCFALGNRAQDVLFVELCEPADQVLDTRQLHQHMKAQKLRRRSKRNTLQGEEKAIPMFPCSAHLFLSQIICALGSLWDNIHQILADLLQVKDPRSETMRTFHLVEISEYTVPSGHLSTESHASTRIPVPSVQWSVCPSCPSLQAAAWQPSSFCHPSPPFPCTVT